MKIVFLGLWFRSLQCPPNSCQNLVIPAKSGGFWSNQVWQEGLLFSSFQQNLGILVLRPECSMECAGKECNRIQLFICSAYVCWSYVTHHNHHHCFYHYHHHHHCDGPANTDAHNNNETMPTTTTMPTAITMPTATTSGFLQIQVDCCGFRSHSCGFWQIPAGMAGAL